MKCIRNVVVGCAIAIIIVSLVGAIYAPTYIRPNDAGSDPVQTEQVKARTEVAKLYASIATGLVVIAGLIFTGLTFYLNRETFELTRKSQLIERFTKAAEQFGEDNASKKLGGMYALVQVASISPEYLWPSVEILAAYVRKAAPLDLVGTGMPPRPDNEIQAILSILGERIQYPQSLNSHTIDLRATNLGKLDLRNLRLPGRVQQSGVTVNLSDADLREAKLDSVQLQGANLSNADLRGATTFGAIFDGANLRTAKMSQRQFEQIRSTSGDDPIRPAQWDERQPDE